MRKIPNLVFEMKCLFQVNVCHFLFQSNFSNAECKIKGTAERKRERERERERERARERREREVLIISLITRGSLTIGRWHSRQLPPRDQILSAV